MIMTIERMSVVASFFHWLWVGAGEVSMIFDARTEMVLGLGFILGLKHALDADHLVAVSTIVSEHHSLIRSSLIGAFWGVGHTLSLLLVGLVVIGLRVTIPERVALGLEFAVAVMLVLLGASVLYKAVRLKLHVHAHLHPTERGLKKHTHVHVHVAETHHHGEHQHFLTQARRPLLVGMVHGLAGSAALMLLVLTTISSPWLALIYIGVFGVGSIGGMLVMSSLIGLPFVWTARRFDGLHRAIRLTAGMFSIIFGFYLGWQIGFHEGLFR